MNVSFRIIFTPSGQRSGEGIKTIKYIISRWLSKYDYNDNYDGLDLEWVKEELTDEEIAAFRL